MNEQEQEFLRHFMELTDNCQRSLIELMRLAAPNEGGGGCDAD